MEESKQSPQKMMDAHQQIKRNANWIGNTISEIFVGTKTLLMKSVKENGESSIFH
jgi:hypothetical protein